MQIPIVSNIRIYPIKSLDPVEVSEVEIGIHSLKQDRIFALMAEDERFINGKRTGRVNQLKADYDLENGLINLSPRKGGTIETFELKEKNPRLVKYLEDFFEMKMVILHNTQGELLDVPKSSSVTIVGQSSYEKLLTSFPTLSLEDFRLRFRANIELTGVEAFWEDQLFNVPQQGVCFTVGDVNMLGISPRDRCNVPPRNPLTGETDKTFIRRLMDSRAQSLPENSTLEQFGNSYRLTVDAYLPSTERGKTIRLGDEVIIGEPIDLSLIR